MKRFLKAGLALSVLGLHTALAAELSPVLSEKITLYKDCLSATDKQLRISLISPERYEMAMEGACLLEHEDAMAGMKAHLRSIPHPNISYEDALEITEGTMASIRASDQRRRKQFISAYVLWFTSAGRSHNKAQP